MVNKEKLQRIAGALNLEDGDIVVEVGPGHGELTANLKSKKKEIKIIAIEKDNELAVELRNKFPDVEVIEGDALEIIPELTTSNLQLATKYKICGNIPYYITGHLLRIVSELERKPTLSVFVVQKEVAVRICARPPQMNLLAAITRFWAESEIMGFIPKKYFRPAPKIDSAIIRLQTVSDKQKSRDAEKYYKFAKILFKQPRKTIINNLAFGFGGLKKEEIIKKLRKLDIDPQGRPQDLSFDNILGLSTLF